MDQLSFAEELGESLSQMFGDEYNVSVIQLVISSCELSFVFMHFILFSYLHKTKLKGEKDSK